MNKFLKKEHKGNSHINYSYIITYMNTLENNGFHIFHMFSVYSMEKLSAKANLAYFQRDFL